MRLQTRYRALQENLFLFLDDPTIPPTHNASEQALRWSVIFRKVTNGFRSDWDRDLFASVRSIVNTGRRQGFSAFESILAALNPGIPIPSKLSNYQQKLFCCRFQVIRCGECCLTH